MNWGSILEGSFDVLIQGTLGLFENVLLDVCVPASRLIIDGINSINNDFW